MNDRVFLITGASSGIGAATARAAAAAGYRVAVAGRRIEPLNDLVEELGGTDRAMAIGCDVAEWTQVQEMADAVLAGWGRIDVVFANAGFGASRGLQNESPEHWRSMVLTNVLGPALTMRATVDALERTGGHVVITASIAGHVNLPGSLYSATKHAAVALTEGARLELHSRGIRVTAISPGNVDTPFFDNRPQIALHPDDVAQAVMFAVTQPPHVGINEIVMRHRDQTT